MALIPLLLLAPCASSLAQAAGKPARPRFDLRASPPMAFSPVRVLLVGELRGGDDLEEYYCPGVEWEWGDGDRSVQESDCPPFEPGLELPRRFSASHAYHLPGRYQVKVTLRRADRTVAVATTPIMVHSRFGGGPGEE
jgi:hypothetical protein